MGLEQSGSAALPEALCAGKLARDRLVLLEPVKADAVTGDDDAGRDLARRPSSKYGGSRTPCRELRSHRHASGRAHLQHYQ